MNVLVFYLTNVFLCPHVYSIKADFFQARHLSVTTLIINAENCPYCKAHCKIRDIACIIMPYKSSIHLFGKARIKDNILKSVTEKYCKTKDVRYPLC